MNQNTIDTILFDLGGVLIDWNPRYLYRKLFANEQEMEYFLTNICTMPWNAQMDKGKPFATATSELAEKHPIYKPEIIAYHKRWKEMLGEAISGTVNILEKVKNSDDLKLHALTNWSAETFPIAQERFEFLQWFEEIVVSGEINMIKPDKEIFHYTANKLSLVPERTIFIDDSLANVKTATELGFKTIHFQNPNELEIALAKWITL